MNFKLLAAAAAVALSAQASFAQSDPPPIPLTFTLSAPNTLTASFERAVSGLFVDTFALSPSRFSGDVSVSLRPVQGPIHFFSALLDGEGFSFDPDAGNTTFDFSSKVSAGATLPLTVLGFAGDADTLTASAGTYAGAITVQLAAVPEPQTYALMLAGLAVVGGMARRSRRRERPAR
jgi:hypothetical protein